MSSIVAKDVDQTNSLVWFRNDLRIDDHTGLKSAIENSSKVIGIYCFNPKLYVENKLGFKKTDNFRAKFLIQTVENLKKNLKKN
jgi:deoxyribodipyrimidine photo-lyase